MIKNQGDLIKSNSKLHKYCWCLKYNWRVFWWSSRNNWSSLSDINQCTLPAGMVRVCSRLDNNVAPYYNVRCVVSLTAVITVTRFATKWLDTQSWKKNWIHYWVFKCVQRCTLHVIEETFRSSSHHHRHRSIESWYTYHDLCGLYIYVTA